MCVCVCVCVMHVRAVCPFPYSLSLCSVGIENVDDLIRDLAQALEKI